MNLRRIMITEIFNYVKTIKRYDKQYNLIVILIILNAINAGNPGIFKSLLYIVIPNSVLSSAYVSSFNISTFIQNSTYILIKLCMYAVYLYFGFTLIVNFIGLMFKGSYKYRVTALYSISRLFLEQMAFVCINILIIGVLVITLYDLEFIRDMYFPFSEKYLLTAIPVLIAFTLNLIGMFIKLLRFLELTDDE